MWLGSKGRDGAERFDCSPEEGSPKQSHPGSEGSVDAVAITRDIPRAWAGGEVGHGPTLACLKVPFGKLDKQGQLPSGDLRVEVRDRWWPSK